MFENLLRIITSFSFEVVPLFTGIISLIITFYSYLLTKRQKKKILNTVRKDKIDDVLATDDIKILGDYLTYSLETITIAQYSSNENVNKNVNIFLNKIQNYLLRQDEVDKIEIPENIETGNVVPPQVPNEFDPIIEELKYGEPWNALAKLRRYLELYFRNIAEINNIDVSNVRSISQLFHLLYKSEIIYMPEFDKLKQAINISNRAIHGVNISREEAEKAINLVIDAFNKINK